MGIIIIIIISSFIHIFTDCRFVVDKVGYAPGEGSCINHYHGKINPEINKQMVIVVIETKKHVQQQSLRMYI